MKETIECLITKTTTQQDLKYLLYQPEEATAADSGYPLMLFLHGMGERGDDLAFVKRHGPPARIADGAEFPFVLVAPQCPLGAVWQNECLQALLDELTQRLDIDPNKIYLTGLSMGGAGTWALANACPERFAAIAPICGPFSMIDPVNFKNIPVWCFHGAMDESVPLTDSIRLVRSLRAHGASVRFTVYPDAGHVSWTEAYAGTELYEWLEEQRG
ncbi:MAG: prolyl oligopeptidase family serine peptidase [Kiritimatiellia bacterium]